MGDSSSSSIDLILDIRGNGQTYGTGDDAIRIMNELPGASNIQITGQANCGKKQGSYHQDGVQALGGTNITFVDFTIGNYDAGIATCQAAGGIIFYSGSPRNMNVVRGKFIGCNHGLLDGDAAFFGLRGRSAIPDRPLRYGHWPVRGRELRTAVRGVPALPHVEPARDAERPDLPAVEPNHSPVGRAVGS